MEVQVQGKKLEKLDDNIDVVDRNAEQGLGELKKADKYAKKSKKCTCWIVMILLFLLLIGAAVFYFAVIN